MKNRTTYRKVAVNVLIAIVISLMVNFAYFVLLLLGPQFNQQRSDAPAEPPLAVEAAAAKINDRQGLAVGRLEIDSLQNNVIIREENIGRMSNRRFGSNPLSGRTGKLYIATDFFFYFAASLIFLTIITLTDNKNRSRYLRRLLLCLALSVLLYFLAPQMTGRGQILVTAQTRLFNPMLLLKLSVTFVITMLYGKIYELLYKNQSMVLENEQLKNENLTSQYNVLVNQVNPHFLFNSLNSLSMLIRDGKTDAALTYIDQMSDTYRYIIQDGANNFTSVENELQFLDAYKYLLEIRYAGKLHISVDVPEEYRRRVIPPLSLQPLIENAVKHNSITSLRPMLIEITVADGYLVVSNRITPKLDHEEDGTGIGLNNLASRYRLLTGREVIITDDGEHFTVKLPLGQAE